MTKTVGGTSLIFFSNSLKNRFLFLYFTDATTLLGTNRKLDSEDKTSADTKTSTKLTQDDFKTVYTSKIIPNEEKDVSGKEIAKSKMVELDNDPYEVVDSTYVCIRLKQK